MHPLRPPFEPHFVHLAGRCGGSASIHPSTSLFYGGEVLATLERL